MNNLKNALPAIRADIDKLLAALAPKYGLKQLKLGNGTYTPDGSFTFKLEGVTGDGLSKDEQYYELARAAHHELPPRGTTVDYAGQAGTFFGANTTLSKLKYKRADGSVWLTPTDHAVRIFARQDTPRGRKYSEAVLAGALVPAPGKPL